MIIDVKDYPYEITFGKDRYHLNRQMEDWCRINVGEGGWIRSDEGLWIIESMFGTTTFSFKDQKDLVWFILRWS
jgi:hypothetical protein